MERQVRGYPEPGGCSQPLVRFGVESQICPLPVCDSSHSRTTRTICWVMGGRKGAGHAAGHAVSASMFATGIVALGAAGTEVSPCGKQGRACERYQLSQTSQPPAEACLHTRSRPAHPHSPSAQTYRGSHSHEGVPSEVPSGPLCRLGLRPWGGPPCGPHALTVLLCPSCSMSTAFARSRVPLPGSRQAPPAVSRSPSPEDPAATSGEKTHHPPRLSSTPAGGSAGRAELLLPQSLACLT